MKKLMIVAAIVCAAVVSQAASIDWTVANFAWTDSEGKNPARDTYVYLINGDTSLDTIASAIKDGNYASQEWFYGSAQTDNTKGRISSNTLTPKNEVAPGEFVDRLVRGREYNFSALMIEGTGADAKYMVSETFAQSAYLAGTDEAMSADFTSLQMNANAQTYNASTAPNGWAAVSVPEPTSAMLLLLGMAGLALRRRRA